MALLFCDICNRSIPADEIRFAEERNNVVYCRECRQPVDPQPGAAASASARTQPRARRPVSPAGASAASHSSTAGHAQGPTDGPRWGRWILFLCINLFWFMSIIVITETFGSPLVVVGLSVAALVIYASTLLWLHNTLTK